MSQFGCNAAAVPATPIGLNPIDRLVDSLSAQHKEGFVLGLAKDATNEKQVLVTVRKDVPPPDEWEPPTAYRNHTIADTESLAIYAKKYGSPESSLVVVGDEDIVLVLDEEKEVGSRERATLTFPFSDEWRGWSNVVDRPTEQREIVRAALNLDYTLEDSKLLAAARKAGVTAMIKRDSDLRDDGETMGVVFSTAGNDSIVSFPKKFRVSCPVLEDDADKQSFEVRVEILFPSNPNEQLRFMLTSHERRELLRRRLKAEADRLRTLLGDGWIVVRGAHAEMDRKIGQRPR